MLSGSLQTVKKTNNKLSLFGKCQRTGCMKNAHSYGYCGFHGGNGVTKSYIKEKAIDDFLAGKPEFD